ncbi:LysR family transcriptional regulator [Vineibacter terrae]|uniref:LysR family transcriptional regulator n=1 Tax=Vineibacter terrae TaxID=2586908 RepID=A0A5C8PK99_9HYPH|nr:LysR substrate-binding domain-containing protein [Vineibacter terrae]TXL73784.1 LysR family transcriptional regulator [Vineibacter terrae]
MNLRQIEVFRAVMLAGSVTGAARLLRVSQPGISRMLSHVELQLGVRLFERGKGRLRPTPEARALHREVEQVYRGVQRIDACAGALRDGAHLSLRVLASPSTALEVVPRAVSQLALQFPQARIYMETALVRDMVSQLVNNEADIAVSTLAIEHAMLVSQPVGRWSLTCVFPAGHALAARRSVSPRDIAGERLISFSSDTPQGRLISDWRRQHAALPSSQIEVRAGQVACSLAACGAGVAIVDDLTARAWPTDRLGFRPIAGSPTFEIFAVRNEGAPSSFLAAAFVEKVAAGFRELARPAGGRARRPAARP